MLATFTAAMWTTTSRDPDHMKFRSCLLLSSLLLPLAATAEPWLRIEQPTAALRAQLPAHAIDYGSFIWMPAAAAPTESNVRAPSANAS